MKIIVISDLHGHLPTIKEECELILICGDICPIWNHDYEYQYNWFLYTFCDWVNTLSCKKVIFIAGNHDLMFEQNSRLGTLFIKMKRETDFKLEYLENSLYIHSFEDKQYKIYGTPYCKIYGNWAFMRSGETLINLFSEIPNDLDILLTHDAAYKYGDVCYGLSHVGNIGNIQLADAILRAQPKYHFHGHLHTSEHDETKINNTRSYNVSLVNEQIMQVYEPLILEI